MASTAETPVEAAPETGSARDLERGEKEEKEQQGSSNDFPTAYYLIWIFSILVVVQGVHAHLRDPQEVRHPRLNLAIEIGSLVTGVFLLLNADLFVTYIRLRREAAAFRANNAKYQESLREQKKEIAKLQETEKAFKVLDAKFGGSMDRANEEIEQIRLTAKDGIASTINQVAVIKRMKVVTSEQMGTFLDSICHLYICIFHDLPERVEEMKKGMSQSEKYWNDGSMRPERIGVIFQRGLFLDIPAIAEFARAVTDAAEGEGLAVASGKA